MYIGVDCGTQSTKVVADVDAGIDPRTIRAIGVSGQQHGLVALDAAGEPVHPAKLWCDTETTTPHWLSDWAARLVAWTNRG